MKSVLASLRRWMAAFIVTLAGPKAVLFGLAFAMASGLVSIPVSAQVVAYPVDTMTTVAGTGLTGGTTCAGTGAAASTTALRSPVAAAVDGSGNVYVIDGNCVLKLSSSNILTTVAGTGAAGFSGDGGLATNAQLDAPAAIALDTSGNIYIADTGNNRIREITVSNGLINTVAGSGPAGAAGSFGGDYNYAVDALLNQPKGIAVDVYGEMFIADTNNQRIREVSTNGVIFTVAGNGTAGYNGDDVPSLTIQSINQELNYPEGIMLDGSSNLYIADSGNNRIRRLNYYNGHVYINGVQWSGAMFTVAGDGTYGGLGDFGPATSAELGAPNAVAVNTSLGSLWISDASHRVRQVDFDSGIIHTVAGTGNEGFSGDGGPAVLAQMGVFTAVAADFSGNLYIADRDNLRVRLVSVPPALSFPNTAIGSTSASQTFLFETGASESISSVQVTGASNPNGADFTANLTNCSVGVTYAAGTLCSVAAAFKPAFPGLRNAPAVVTTSQGTFQVGLSGIGLGAQANFLPVTTTIFAGTGTPGDTGDGGPATSAQLNAPQGLWANGDGSLLIVDSGNDSVRRVTSNGTISTIDGAEGTFGLGRSAVEDSTGNLFFSSQGIVYRLDANTGAVTTYAGASGADGLTNGVDANLATFTSPTSMAFDSSGNLYIADSGTNLVRRISAQNHQIVTVAGNGTAGDSGDSGLATNAEINGPLAITIDASGNLYIAEGNGNRVRKVSATTGTISTVAGNGTAANTGDGGAATSASLNAPNGIAVDAAGNLYIVAPPSLRIVFSGSQTITTVGGTSFVSPCCAAVDGAGNIYVSDSSTGAGGSVVYKVPTATPPSFTFATTGINQTSSDSPKAATIWDSGNASLGYLVPATGANPSVSANFTYDAANSGACAQSFAGSSMVSLPVGQDCTFPISFTPTSVGDISGSLVLTDNSDSASSTTQTIPLNGIGEDGLVKFTLTGLVNAVSGSPQTLTVTAINQTNGTFTGYLGTVHFSSTDPAATLPADYTFTAADAGQHTFSLTLNSLGAQTVTATDTTTTADTGSETVTISPLTFVLTGLVAGSSGQSQTLTVRATNSGGATLTSFTGTVTFTSTDPAATLPTNYTFTTADAGVHTFTLTLNTTGAQTVTATDTASAAETGSETVIISAPTLALTGLVAGSSGQQQAVTVKVTNSGGTTLTSFTGTVAFTSNDPAATLPPNYTFTAADAGVHTFTLELRTAGTDSVTVTEVQVPAATATQTAAITATHFTVTGPATVTAGNVQSYTVQALTTADTVLANYVGTVDVTNTDTAATFPASCLFTTAAAGTCVISVTFQTTGSQTLAATDAEIASQNGSEVVTVNPAPYTLTASLPVSQTATIGSAFASPLTVTLRDPSGNPVAGATVTFAAPATGASALLSSTSAATNSSGVASITATANGTAGIYTVTASTSNVSTPATFYLTNAKVTEALALTAQVQAVTGSDNVVLTAVLSPTSAGGSVPTGTISFYDGGTLLSVQTVANAQASFTEVNPGQGTHNYSATYSGDGNFSGATGTATALVSQSTATVTLSNLNQTYNGSPKPVTVTVSPGGLAYSVTYNGSATVPTDAGSYTVVATVTTSGYNASSTGTLVIAKGTASFIFQAEPAVTYNGKPQPFDDPVTVLTGPSNPTFTYTYNGSSTVPTNAGGYTVVATLVDPNWQATVQTFWVISYVAVTTSFAVSPNVTYGQPVTVQGSISPDAENSIPAGGVFQFTSNSANLGSPAALMNGTASYTYYPPAGTYSLGGTYSGDPNYLPVNMGSPRTVVVSQASTTLTSSAAQPVQIAYGAGTSIPLTITGQYSGAGISVPTGPVVYNIGSGSQMTAASTNGIASITIPSTLDAGTYTVTATYNGDSNYLSSSTTVTVIVSKATANVTLSGLSVVYNGSPKPVTASTTPGGLPVTLTYNGSATAPTAAGSYAVVATVNSPNYTGSTTGTLVISQAGAAVVLSNLTATYNGSPHAATATTTPSGLPVTLTYNGSSTVPSAQGSYTVVATINDPNYTGTATGILVISKSTAIVTLGNLSATYDGNAHAATATTTPAGLSVTLTYNGTTTAPTAVGSYTVVGTINDPDYAGSSTGTLVISREAATVTLGNLSATYNGSPQSASATTSPLNLAVALTYNGSSTPPTAAGSYTVVGTISDPQYTGTATGTLIIAKATATVSLSNLAASYDGNPHAATVITTPSGLTVTVTYNGSTTAPSAIGNYTVVATVVDPNYTGTATGTLTIGSINATVTLSNLAATYDGNPHAATATTNPAGLSVAITYNGSATVPASAGSYAVVATITSASYTGSTTGTLVIAKATAAITLSGLSSTYNGSAQPATATTVPSGLGVTLTYNGTSTVPSAAGSYSVIATVNDANYMGSATGTLVIAKAMATVTLGNLSATYDGNLHAATATTTPTGLSVTFTYNGSATVPSAVGSYTVVATITDPNYTGSATGTLTISSGTAPITLSNLTATYDGNPHAATATTNPAGLSVSITYNGSGTVPVAAGSYAVVATITSPGYNGSATGTLVIAKATATVTLANLSPTYNGSPQNVTATTTPSGLGVTLTYSGNSTAPSAAGGYSVVANVNDANYTGSATATLVIAKATATVTLSSLSATYDGNPHPAIAVTAPAGLGITLTYNGSATVPSAVGNYTVVATITDPNYTGSATGTLTISSGTAPITLSNLTATYDGNPHAATATTNPSGLSVSITYNGSSTIPIAAGSYAVVATITSPGYNGSTTGTLVIAKANATVTLGNLSATYDGNPHAATATTTPAGLSLSITYSGSPTPPSAVGSYAVLATITDPNYTGSATGTLTISSNSAAVVLSNLNAAYDGNPHAATATTTPAGLTVSIIYNGSTTVPVAAGSYAVVATITSSGYSGSTSGTLVIAKASATVTLGNLTATYNGSPQNATATTTPAGLAVSFTYNGAVGAPSAIGTYAVVATVTDPNYGGSASGVLVISQASATVTLTNLNVTYDGNPHAATATTTPASLPVSITYNGSSTVPVAAGSYAVVATVTSPNYTGSANGTLTIAKAAAAVTLANLNVTYNGNPQPAAVTTVPAGLAVTVTYNGSANAPSAVGSYAVIATVNDPNYSGSATGTLTISKVNATVVLSGLVASFDGTPHAAIATTSPTGLSVSITYNGSATVPITAGSYTVVATINDPLYTGTATATLTIAKAPATLTLTASASALNPGQSVTLTAIVAASTIPQPTGQVTLFDNGTSLGSFNIVNGTVNDPLLLSPGTTHVITASYSGDIDFLGTTSNSASVTVAALDYTFASTAANTQPVQAGNSATFTFALAPFLNAPYPGQVTFAVDGLPSGDHATFSPSTVAAIAGPQTITLTIATSSTPAIRTGPGGSTPFKLGAFLLLPFLFCRKLRRRLPSQLLLLVAVVGSLMAVAGLSGCGTNSFDFYHQLTVTATSGTQQHSAPVVLIVR